MKFVEENAYSLNEGLEQSGFKNVVKNITMTYNKGIADEELEKLADKYLVNEGDCFVVIKKNGHPDKKVRPYKTNNISSKGTTKFTAATLLVDEAGNPITILQGKKPEVMSKVKKMFMDKELTKTVIAKKIRIADEDQADSFKIEYSPSKNFELGEYLFIGK